MAASGGVGASGSGSGSGGGGGGGGTSTSTACAACKYQRRKCTADCPLSPYFPPDQPKRFQNVHKLFGVSNILRILKHVDPSKREDTVKSIAYEADTREKDPVHGCLGVITILQNQVSKLKDELAVAREQLFLLQQHQQQHNFHHQQAQMQEIVVGSTALVNVGGESSVLMQQQHLQQQYNDMTQLSSDLAKSTVPLPTSPFEPDQYLRTDSFDGPIKPPGSASTSNRFDAARYIRGESPVIQSPLLGPVKEDHRSASMHYGMGDSSTTTFLEQELELDHHHAFEDPYAMAIRRPGSSGILNLSETQLRRGSHGVIVAEHELRSAGVYLTLTNN